MLQCYYWVFFFITCGGRDIYISALQYPENIVTLTVLRYYYYLDALNICVQGVDEEIRSGGTDVTEV